MIKKILLGLSGVALLGSLLTFGAFNYKASNTQDFEHSDFKIVEVVKNEKYQQLSYFFSGSFPIDLTKLDMNNKEDVDFVNNIPALQQTNDINTTFSEELDESKGVLFSDAQNQQLGYYEQSLDGTGKYYAVFYDKSIEYDLYLIKDSEQSLVENNNIDSTLLDYYFYEIDGRFYPYLDIIELQDDEQYIVRFEEYDEDSKIDADNSWNFVPAYSGNTYSQNEDKTYSLKSGIKTIDYATYDKLSDKPILKINSSNNAEPDTVPSDKPEDNTEGTTETVPSKTLVESTESNTEGNTETTPSKNPTDNTEGNTETAPIEVTKIRGSILAYEYINAGDSNFAFNSIFSQKYANPTVRVINYDDLTAADIEDADLIYFNTNSEDTFYSKEYEKYNKSTDSLSEIDVFTSDIDKKIIDKLYNNKLIVLWGSEFKTNALQHEKMSKTDLVYALTSNTYASIVKNGKLNSDKTLYDYLDSYDGSLKELYSDVPTFTSAEDTASADTLQRFNIVNTDLAYNICLHGILDLPSDDLISDWGSLLIEKNTLNEKVVGDASSISIESGVSYLLNEDRASGLGSNARLLEIEPCDDYTDKNYWNWRMFGIAPYFTGDVTVEQMNIDEFVCKNTDLLSAYDVIFIGSNYNITKQGGMPYSQWIVDDTVKKYSVALNYTKFGICEKVTSVPLNDIYKGDNLSIRSISAIGINHKHESNLGDCNGNDLHEISINFENNVFNINSNTEGNYKITVTTVEGVTITFNYICFSSKRFTSKNYYPLTSAVLENPNNWQSGKAFDANGNIIDADDNYCIIKDYYVVESYKTEKLEINAPLYEQESNSYAGYLTDIKIICYDSNLCMLGVYSENSIPAHIGVSYIRFGGRFKKLSWGDIPFDKEHKYYIKGTMYYSGSSRPVDLAYDCDFYRAATVKKGEPVTFKFDSKDYVGLDSYSFPSNHYQFKEKYNIQTDGSVPGQITLTYTGDIVNDIVSPYMAIEVRDEDGYSHRIWIYFNLFIKGDTTTDLIWSSKGGFPTKFNDSAMNGKIYYHVGDITSTINSGDKFYAGAVDDNADLNGINTTTPLNKSTRLSGNDLTKKMYDKLTEYASSGRALILSDQLYNEDGTINEAGVDTSSYVYKLMNEYKDKIVNDKDSINFDFSYLDEGSFNLDVEDMPLVYRDYTLFDFDDTKKIAKLSSKKLKNNSNMDSDSDTYNCEDGGKTEYTYDELGITSSDEANTAFYANRNNKANKQIELKFKIKTNSSYTGTYNAKFYFDKVSDGVFNEAEKLDFYSIRDENGNSYNSSNLIADKTYIAKINLDKDFSGCLHWKLLITRGDLDNIRDSFESYCAFLPTERTRLDILQITPYASANGWKTDNSALTSFDSFMQLVKDNQDYDIHIKVINAEDFNNLDFSSYLVYDEDKNIKKTFAQMDMLILGFGDFGDYVWTDDALANLCGFVSIGKPVLATHDSTSFVNTLSSIDKIWGVDLNSSPQITKNYYINRYLRNLFGQDKYGVTLRALNLEICLANAKSAFVKSLGAQSEEFLNDAKRNGKDLAYTLDSKQSSTYYDIDGMTPYINGTMIQNSNIQSASIVNRGQISSYPYYIPDHITINKTHPQYYQLDLEDPNLTVWCTLDSDDVNNKDGQNFYYSYSRGNVAYTGLGHEQLRDDMSLFEWKLFFNTIIMAYRQAKPMHLVCTSDNLEQYGNVIQMYADFATATHNVYADALFSNDGIRDPAVRTPLSANFKVNGVESLFDTTDMLYIHLEGVTMKLDYDNFFKWTDLYQKGILKEGTDYLFKRGSADYTFSIYGNMSSIFTWEVLGNVGKVELIRMSENGIKQVLDTKIINVTRRSAYDIR